MGAATKVVLFDLYRTLIDLVVDEEGVEAYERLARWLSYHGLPVQGPVLRRLYRAGAASLHGAQPGPNADIDITRVFASILRELGAPEDDATAALVGETCVLFRAMTTVSLGIYPETPLVLERLTSAGFRLGLVSNAQRAFSVPELRSFGIDRQFERLVFSSDLGLMKPRPEIFRRALDELGTDATGAVFVGDNLFDDVWGAGQVGLRTLWIDRGSHDTVPPGYHRPTPDAVLASGELGRIPEVVLAMAAGGELSFRSPR